MITNQTVGEEGKGGRSGKPKPSISIDANTATSVGMIHESELTFVGMSFFQRWELADLRTKGLFFGS